MRRPSEVMELTRVQWLLPPLRCRGEAPEEKKAGPGAKPMVGSKGRSPWLPYDCTCTGILITWVFERPTSITSGCCGLIWVIHSNYPMFVVWIKHHSQLHQLFLLPPWFTLNVKWFHWIWHQHSDTLLRCCYLRH